MAQAPAVLEIWLEGVPADAQLVDALARFALAARRAGSRATVRGASREMAGLIELCGLQFLLEDRGRSVELER